MNAHHIIMVVGGWILFALFLAILFSMLKEVMKIEAWKERVAMEMCSRFNVRSDRAWEIVERAYPTRKAMYVVERVNPRLEAMRLFWVSADSGEWMPAHFNDRKLPESLYFHPSWGGMIVEA